MPSPGCATGAPAADAPTTGRQRGHAGAAVGYVSRYDFKRSDEDGSTVNLVYESTL
ncbi:MAG: hypothetical protein V3U32_06595 [Anaerolineales bacterium]